VSKVRERKKRRKIGSLTIHYEFQSSGSTSSAIKDKREVGEGETVNAGEGEGGTTSAKFNCIIRTNGNLDLPNPEFPQKVKT